MHLPKRERPFDYYYPKIHLGMAWVKSRIFLEKLLILLAKFFEVLIRKLYTQVLGNRSQELTEIAGMVSRVVKDFAVVHFPVSADKNVSETRHPNKS
jgi:hypothetical protein